MAWELTVYTIDVGQGDSSLIVAEDVPGGQHRTILIDGGLQMYAPTLHTFLTSILGPKGYMLDFILVSHYDEDHYGGIVGLLNADNMSQVSRIVTRAVVAAVSNPLRTTRPQRVACAALAAAATVFGAYGANGGQIATMCDSVASQVGDRNDEDAAVFGFNWANYYTVPNRETPSLEVGASQRQKQLAFNSGVAAASAVEGKLPLTQSVLPVVFAFMSTTINANSRFNTGAQYRNVCLLDTGEHFEPDAYVKAVAGRYGTEQDRLMIVPGIERDRVIPDLGEEFLWNTDPGKMSAPANSPAMFCIACQGYLWQGIGNDPEYIGDNNTNQMSIASVIRFGSFYFYTGGDLTTAYEKPLATAITTCALPNPQDPINPFPAPPLIAAFKCGHHGSKHSTSKDFLDTMKSKSTFISCGKGQFGGENLPSPDTTEQLQKHGSITRYYMTNCSYLTAYVPASNGEDQMVAPGNKSRVAGQNNLPNLAALRNRGNIRLFLTQNESLGAGVQKQFHVTYYDDDDNMGAPWGMLTDVLPF